MGIFKCGLISSLILSLSLFSAVPARADSYDTSDDSYGVALVGIAVVGAAVYFFMNRDKDDEETANLMSRYSKGEGIRLNAFEAPIHLSLMARDERATFIHKKGGFTDIVGSNTRSEKENVQVLKISYEW